ncbi:MAG: DUF2284 domain-containing protein [Desulfobacterales bacterium]|nr:DUF2284 domain-containing protein [Desulfobacterales bacterium]
MTEPYKTEELLQLAVSLGASDARAIDAGQICVEDALARHCLKPRCENFGLSPSCPPHVSGPAGFRKLQEKLEHAIVVRIVLPSAVLFSAERREVMGLLHQIVAGIEREAVEMGYVDSKGFAGGSCKTIFCHDHDACRRLSEDGQCRHPESARPSMSGFGINVSQLMQTCGWPAKINVRRAESDPEAMTWVAGLVLIG